MTWSLLHAKFHTTLGQKQLLRQGGNLLIALSGGQDSLCLTKLLLDLQSKWQWNIAIAHCDHRWASDEGMANNVAKIAHHWQIPCYIQTAITPIHNSEAAARNWRYETLLGLAQTQGFNHIVTGHTQSDRAETLIYNLIRGSGTTGLSALTWQRNLTPEIQLVRPLLNISRSETLIFCQQYKLPIWEDLVNQDLKYARNRIRLDLIPYIQQEFNPKVEKTLAQTAEILRAESEYLEQISEQILENNLSFDRKSLNRKNLKNVPLGLQRRVIRRFLQQHIPQALNFEQIECITQLITAPNRTCTSSLPKGITVQVEEEWIIIIGC